MASPKTDFIETLKLEFGQFNFIPAKRFKWHAPKSIYFEENSGYPLQYFALLTLHELGHALCGHKDYKTDVERLRIESEAWQRAKTLISEHESWQKDFGIVYDEDFAENELDSYRDWLHTKSRCKNCGLTRYQTKDGKYHCPNCDL